MRPALISFPAVLLFANLAVADAPPDAAGREFFEQKVRPVLVKHCYRCHSVKANKAKGGLLLDSRDGLRKGGDSGPGVVPGEPKKSLLIKAVHHDGLQMPPPPEAALAKHVVADLEAWVKRGAPDPRVSAPLKPAASWKETLAQRRRWWSLQPVHKPVVPSVKDILWSTQPVDRFVLARLERAGLRPAAEADRRTLLRRVSLVLTGLPPQPAEVEAFARDPSPSAYARVVDRLLASPHFGERWARHWLDVVRFSETHGSEWNYEVHNAWRYRDYLIRALNQDVPYDQLIREHIAGDLLPRPRWNRCEGYNESVIGAAFYRFGEVNHDCVQFPQIGFDVLDNQIDTLGKFFQATTVACARCHDHKYDAVSTRDYHALLGILRSSRLINRTIDAPEINAGPMKRLRELKAGIRKEIAGVWLREAPLVSRYLLAAQAGLEKQPGAAELARGLDDRRLSRWRAALQDGKALEDDVLTPWRSLRSARGTAFAAALQKQAASFVQEERDRRTLDEQQYKTFADFRAGRCAGWREDGHGLREGPRPPGDFVLHHEGDALLKTVLPAGYFTHTLSEKLNGSLRSSLLPPGLKRISFEVAGQHSSAVRLVQNNCQLSYTNYRALTKDRLHWVTFNVPENASALRVYAELMTMFDNPKFPDPIAHLAGDRANYKVPWDKAAANPRSFFGVTRVVVHDGPAPPKPERSHLMRLFNGTQPRTQGDWAARHAQVVEKAIRAWAADRATDDDARWLDGLLQRGLLGNTTSMTRRLAELTDQYRAVEKQLTLPRIVPGIEDFDAGFDQPVFVRGDLNKPSERVPRRYLEVLCKTGERFNPTGSGRRELAEHIASADNPLTARVMVNRIWGRLFGEGIVRTVDDFGRLGEEPSEEDRRLLDYLAGRFVEQGWSMKQLIRSLVLTQTFQMANQPAEAARKIDPQNRLLQHYPARRMEAEAVRDAILAASGRLDRRLFGKSVEPYREKEEAAIRLFSGPLDGGGRRSLYIKNRLLEGPKFLAAFNFPGGKLAQGKRDVTNVPAQALALLNDPFVLQQAGAWAETLVARPDRDVGVRIDFLVQTALSRPAAPDERARLEKAVGSLAAIYQIPPGEVLKSQEIWKVLVHTVFNFEEFITIP